MPTGPIANLLGKVNANNELVVEASVSISGADGAILDGVNSAIKATVLDLTSANPQAVAIVDANGDQVTSFGGGTQYAQGTASTDTDTMTMAGVERRDTPANPTGVADGGRTMPAVDSEGVLWTRLRQQTDMDTGAGSVPTDSVALLLPKSGGPVSAIGGAGAVSEQVLRVTLASDDPAVVSLAILDDWDESDRAKVNPIVGQAGVAAGAGAVGATVQRTTLASDDPAVASLAILDDWDESDRAKVNIIVGQAGIAAGTGVDGATVPRVSLATNVPLPAGTLVIGRVGHDITGIAHGVQTVTTAGTDVALASSTACKRVTIQAQTDNTSGIAVGAAGVDATIATGTGVFLNPGDVFELDIDNLADVFIDSLVNGEGVRYTYFT